MSRPTSDQGCIVKPGSQADNGKCRPQMIADVESRKYFFLCTLVESFGGREQLNHPMLIKCLLKMEGPGVRMPKRQSATP